MKAINPKNQNLLNSLLAKIEHYKNVPGEKIVYTHLAKQVANSEKAI